jgi:hypothetical protein
MPLYYFKFFQSKPKSQATSLLGNPAFSGSVAFAPSRPAAFRPYLAIGLALSYILIVKATRKIHAKSGGCARKILVIITGG